MEHAKLDMMISMSQVNEAPPTLLSKTEARTHVHYIITDMVSMISTVDNSHQFKRHL